MALGVSNTQRWWPGDEPGIEWIPFFVFPPAIRKVIYTTNAIESINAQLRKIIKTGATSRRMTQRPS
nr:transposase [Pseudomonas baetica]